MPGSTDPFDTATIDSLLAGSPYWTLYKGLYDNKVPIHARLADGTCLEMHIIGFCQDVKADGTKAGITLQSVNIPSARTMGASSGTSGWGGNPPLRAYYRSMFDANLMASIVTVRKYQLLGLPSLQGPTNETVFAPSSYEVYGWTTGTDMATGWSNNMESGTPAPYKLTYRYFREGGSRVKLWDGSACGWFLRSGVGASSSGGVAGTTWLYVRATGALNNITSTDGAGVAPCFAL